MVWGTATQGDAGGAGRAPYSEERFIMNWLKSVSSQGLANLLRKVGLPVAAVERQQPGLQLMLRLLPAADC